jgi:hypothetical protein
MNNESFDSAISALGINYGEDHEKKRMHILRTLAQAMGSGELSKMQLNRVLFFIESQMPCERWTSEINQILNPLISRARIGVPETLT